NGSTAPPIAPSACRSTPTSIPANSVRCPTRCQPMITPIKENITAWSGLPTDLATPADSEAGRLRVHLVDDDSDFREAAAAELDFLGLGVTAVPDGEAMVRYLAEGNACDVIILDWKLPARPGVDYLRSLRQQNVTVPVIILTGLPDTAYENVAL